MIELTGENFLHKLNPIDSRERSDSDKEDFILIGPLDVYKCLEAAKKDFTQFNCIVVDARDIDSYQTGHIASTNIVSTYNFNCTSKMMAKMAVNTWKSYFKQYENYSKNFLSNTILIYDQSSEHINTTAIHDESECQNNGLVHFIKTLTMSGCRVAMLKGGYSSFVRLGDKVDEYIRRISDPNKQINISSSFVFKPRFEEQFNLDKNYSMVMKTLEDQLHEDLNEIELSNINMGLINTKISGVNCNEPQVTVGQRIARSKLNPLPFLVADGATNRVEFTKQHSGTDIWNANISKILDYLYLGNSKDAQNVELLESNCITHIINVTDNEPMSSEDKFKCLRLSATDNVEQDLIPVFNQANEFIASARESNGIVLIHCQAGVSRSVSVVIAYLMKIRSEFTVGDALSYVQSKRPIAGPNLHFMGQLEAYWKDLHAHDDCDLTMPRRPSLDNFSRINSTKDSDDSPTSFESYSS